MTVSTELKEGETCHDCDTGERFEVVRVHGPFVVASSRGVIVGMIATPRRKDGKQVHDLIMKLQKGKK